MPYAGRNPAVRQGAFFFTPEALDKLAQGKRVSASPWEQEFPRFLHPERVYFVLLNCCTFGYAGIRYNLYRTLAFLSASSSLSTFCKRSVTSALRSNPARSPACSFTVPAAAIIAALSVERCGDGK